MNSSAGAGSRSLRRYFTEIDRCYARIRGVPAPLSPRDVPVVIDWYERGIPLALVVRVLEEAAARHGTGSTARQPIRSLQFVKRAVEREHRQHRLLVPDRPAGQGGGFDVDALRRAMGRAADALVAPAAAPLGALATEAAAAIRALAVNLPAAVTMKDVQRLESDLAEIDGRISRALPAAYREAHAQARAAAEEMLAPYAAAMPAASREEVLATRADVLLRRGLALPRASLFLLDAP